MERAYVIVWTEYERGMGQRPDGMSVHLTVEEAEAYLDRAWHNRPMDETPDEYSRPENETPMLVVLQDAVFARVLKRDKTVYLGPTQATLEKEPDGRRVLAISNAQLLQRMAKDLESSEPATGAASKTAVSVPLDAGSTVAPVRADESRTFVDLCLAKLAKPEDFKAFLNQWHQGGGRDYPNAWEFLGLTREEFDTLLVDEGKVYEILFKRVLAQNPPVWYSKHVKSDGAYVVHFEGRHEATQVPMVAYQGLDGQIWFRDKDLFFDGRFEKLD
jgi:hypothetical protein